MGRLAGRAVSARTGSGRRRRGDRGAHHCRHHRGGGSCTEPEGPRGGRSPRLRRDIARTALAAALGRRLLRTAADAFEQRRVLHDTALATLTAISRDVLNPGADDVRERAARDAAYLRLVLNGPISPESLPVALATAAQEATGAGLRVHAMRAEPASSSTRPWYGLPHRRSGRRSTTYGCMLASRTPGSRLPRRTGRSWFASSIAASASHHRTPVPAPGSATRFRLG